jgi:ATP-dependent DNA helicase DinG
MNNKFVVIDLETTGNSPKKGDKIIQFAAVVIENGKIVDRFSSLINPKVKIPIFIEELTGINDEMVKNAPNFEDLAGKIQTLLEEAYFVAHNVLFDLSFLQEELLNANEEGFFGSVIDTVEMARFLFPTIDSYKLNDLANLMGFSHNRPHQADSDAEVTAELLLHFLTKMESIPLTTCKQLSELSGGLKSDIQLLFEDLVEKKALKVEKWPIQLEKVNGLVIKKSASLNENQSNREAKEFLFPKSDLTKDYHLKSAFNHYQKRDGQFLMMNEVYDAFTTHQHLVLEAGTGIGKSLGYLLPAAYFSKLTGNKILISTYTTQLQSQLIENDIPILNQILPFEMNIALLKGKSHYICLSKFEESLQDLEDNYDSCLTKMQILVWLLETESGDVDELNLSSGGQIFWNRVRHGQNEKTRNELWQEKDFYLRAKQRVDKADLIITNHALLLTDSSQSYQLLPKIDYLILDEGHHFHKVATKYLGSQLDYFRTRLLLNQFGLREQKQLLYKLEMLVKKQKGNIDFKKVYVILTDLFFEMDEFFKTIRIYVKKVSQQEPIHKISQRINRNNQDFKLLLHSSERFSFKMLELIDSIELIRSFLVNTLLNKDVHVVDELKQLNLELYRLRDNIKRIFLNATEQDVAWIDIDFRSYQNSTTVYLQPVSISQQLQELFFLNKKSVIITSATLSIDNQFSYILNELGLKESTKTIRIPSPFDYRNKVKIFVPKDLPDIRSVSNEEYVAAIAEQIISIAEVTKGRILTLFTAQDMLRKTFTLLKESGLLEDYALIAQGITSGSRSRLTRNFQKFDKAILFGTSSFWEGIDIPGEDLSCLIMVRLPFTPPDDPFMQAKCDETKRRGGNPFMEISLPEAVLKFKQGFGRLIRTEQDKGVFIIFDRRIVTAKYGQSFFNSIPDVDVIESKNEEILNEIRYWLPLE